LDSLNHYGVGSFSLQNLPKASLYAFSIVAISAQFPARSDLLIGQVSVGQVQLRKDNSDTATFALYNISMFVQELKTPKLASKLGNFLRDKPKWREEKADDKYVTWRHFVGVLFNYCGMSLSL
jgi:hypothetical protein